MAGPILLIDGMYLAYSSYYANRTMRTLGGDPTGGLYGFINRVEGLLRDLQPARAAVAFDRPEKTFRHQLYPEYKAQRTPPPEDLLRQLPWIREYLGIRGVPVLELAGYEADDLIALVARREAATGSEVVLFSADKDLFQLIGGGISVFHPKEKRRLDREGLRGYFGIYPEQIADFLALMGDASDNVPGVRGIGEKTALKLIERHGTLDALLAGLEQVEPRWREKIASGREQLELSRRLVDFEHIPPPGRDIPLPGLAPVQEEALAAFYRRFSFQSLLERRKAVRPALVAERELPDKYRIARSRADLQDWADRVAAAGSVALDVETTALDFTRAELVGLSLALADGGVYVPLRFPAGEEVSLTLADVRQVLGPLLADPAIAKTGHNIKFDLLALAASALPVAGVADDTMVASYLLFPERRSHGLKDLTGEFLGARQTTYEELAGKGKSQVPLDQVPLERIGGYCCDDSFLTGQLRGVLAKKLAESGLTRLYRELEMPLVEVLTGMELAGIAIDREYLEGARETLEKRIVTAEHELHSMAGFPFNVNSSQQLGELLFVKMGLPKTRKTPKTGAYSTDSDALAELGDHAVVAAILEYRALKKTLSTYVVGLLEGASPQGRVHTSFNQAVAATGRLSSSDPNLQNIPVGELGGVNLRRAFVAPPGLNLLSADYSQIELRVMAHFSADKQLTGAFAAGEDIHRQTAELVFGPLQGEGAAELRRRAKIINFSIIYGSGAYSLAKGLGVSFGEAKRFIDTYFLRYSGVRDFIDRSIAAAVDDPVVRTLAGRKRQIPEVQSQSRPVRENGQRMVVNTIVQGSAADIIKAAMIRVQRAIAGKKSRLLLQVHDELVFEYPPEEESFLLETVRREMEGAWKLSVPLKVSLKTGPNWA
ncbi:MAG TPA: DNA polymerase I, partial [Candidatus Aminicenantes bacterium]|nr:DNA polymerase I [Candidatus Aminicenantes bacterium]